MQQTVACNERSSLVPQPFITRNHFPCLTPHPQPTCMRELTLRMYDVLSWSKTQILLRFSSDGHSNYDTKVIAVRLRWYYCYYYYYYYFYFLRHDEIWLFKFEPLSAVAFYLTSSELMILQLLGKPTVACSTIIAVYPEGLCSVFILPVWNLTRTLSTKWILVCYPGKSSPQQPRSWQGKHTLGDINWESASQLC